MMEEVRAFAPGRTELAGNHTDHQGGRVLAAAVDCGVLMHVRPRADGKARVVSEGFGSIELDLGETAPLQAEAMTTKALVRGVVAGVRSSGMEVAGFDAHVKSSVPSGGGLSSSAAFELALCSALALMGGGELSPIEQAKIGQMAERDYFGKPCGLMDQLAVALGGVAAFDFANEADPAVERIGFDFEERGYALCLVNTHSDHSLYTDEYALVASDMFDVARFMGAERLRDVPEAAFMERLADVRSALGDVPAMRAIHFYHENRLVDVRKRALLAGDVELFLDATRRSGASSAQYLQNVSTYDRASQPAMVALALADSLLEGTGACRIHGGGFGGSVQAFVPLEKEEAFSAAIDAHLGAGSCRAFNVSKEGATSKWA